MRFCLKGKGFAQWCRAAAFVALALVLSSTQGSFAKDWSCTPPVDAKTADAISKFTHNEYVIDGNLENVRFIENVLKKRLGRKGDLVPCVGQICKISGALYELMHVRKDYRPDGDVSVCSISEYCIDNKCQDNLKSMREVRYLWGDGSLSFQLVKFTDHNVIADMNEMLEFDAAYDPHIRNSFSRFVGLSTSSAIYIDYTIYNDD